jgi:hypothetical protein
VTSLQFGAQPQGPHPSYQEYLQRSAVCTSAARSGPDVGKQPASDVSLFGGLAGGQRLLLTQTAVWQGRSTPGASSRRTAQKTTCSPRSTAERSCSTRDSIKAGLDSNPFRFVNPASTRTHRCPSGASNPAQGRSKQGATGKAVRLPRLVASLPDSARATGEPCDNTVRISSESDRRHICMIRQPFGVCIGAVPCAIHVSCLHLRYAACCLAQACDHWRLPAGGSDDIPPSEASDADVMVYYYDIFVTETKNGQMQLMFVRFHLCAVLALLHSG